MRYLRIFAEQCKMSFMSVTIYRANFILMLIQSIINTVLNIVCIRFIYDSVTSIAGWSFEEMMLLIGTSLLVNQLFRALIFPNQNRFVANINTGKFDCNLLKPVHIMFQINLGNIDVSSLMSAVAPISIVIIYIQKLGHKILISDVIRYIILVSCGVIILSSFMLCINSLVFYFIRVDGLMNVYYIVMSISEKPKEIIPLEILIGVFTFILPAIPIACIPVEIVLGKIDAHYFFAEILLALASIYISRCLVLRGIRKYSSASS